ncbi:COG4648 family protein [Pseudomonas panipatensis]|uniref:COG4648 family protein n=1 Tax=Pseudomonas panipatensis TaxID=428992 RepID=UPI0035B4863B
MSRLIGLALLVAGLLYPFAIYFGIDHLSPKFFAALLGVLWFARSLGPAQRPGQRWMALAALGFCLLLWIVNEPHLLRWYPVLISGLLLGLFAFSLRFGPPLVERLARLREPDLPANAVRYTRQVTWAWVVFFLLNGLIAASLTLWAPLDWWTLYNGLLSYLLMGALFAGEWLVRQRVRGQR